MAAVLAMIAFVLVHAAGAGARAPQEDPVQTVKVAFVHHSVGQNWLDDGQGALAAAMQAHHYFVSDTNYGWGPDSIGDHTDIPDWPTWFTGPSSPTYLAALYDLDEANSPYARTIADPGGQNQIVMFKSCFPNSSLAGLPDDPPDATPGLTVGHAKYVYNDLLTYFGTRQDKLFVVVTAPPNSDASTAANARAFNTWLVQDWLAGYQGRNVAVFDFYNVLTGPDNHHRLVDGVVEHVHTSGMDTAYYTSGDDHPSVEGSRKATEEFVPMLSHFYGIWKSTPGPSTPPASTPPAPTPTVSTPAPTPTVSTSITASPSTPTQTATPAKPGRVTHLGARVKGRRIIVTWEGPRADSYVLQARWGATQWRTVARPGSSARRAVWRTPTPRTSYRLRLAARNSAGRGPFTRVVVPRVAG